MAFSAFCIKKSRMCGIDGKILSHGVMKFLSITDAIILPRKQPICQ